MSRRVHFQDVPHSESIQRECERWIDLLREEFPETSKYEITLTHAGNDHETHVHVTGKHVELASQARHRDLREAVTDAFDRVRRQLRKHHDKKISGRRRDTHRDAAE